MRAKLLAGLIPGIIALATTSQAQQQPAATAATPAPTTESKYNYRDEFAPFFYSKNGNEYRAADGEPGPKYWQNRADYQLAATLNDETNEITGSEVLTYTNNSPQKLDFLWMNMEQNMFKQESRGFAIVPLRGNVKSSRDWGNGQIFDAGFKIKSIKVLGAKGAATDVKFSVTDTRMQVFLPTALAAAGGQLKLKIEYSFIPPNYGS